MNELARSIRLLYEPDASPVIAVSGGVILFFNSAARCVFPSLEEGVRASTVLPRAFVTCDEEIFMTTAQVDGHSFAANGVWYNGMLLLRIHFIPKNVSVSIDYLTTNLRMELSSMHLALDQLCADKNMDEATLSVLKNSYYKLLNCNENIALVYQLINHNFVFHLGPVNLAEWLNNILSSAAPMVSAKGITVQSKIETDIPTIQADPSLLERMLLNLLSNSICHSPVGSSIQVRLVRDGPQLLLAVEDRGCGLSDDTLGRLFSQQIGLPSLLLGEHTSMGLFIVFGVTAFLGGSVTAFNRRRGGAAVHVRLPIDNSNYMSLHSQQKSYASDIDLKERIRIGFIDAMPLQTLTDD